MYSNNNENIKLIRKWISAEDNSFIREWTKEEYQRFDKESRILEEITDSNGTRLIECYCKEEIKARGTQRITEVEGWYNVRSSLSSSITSTYSMYNGMRW